LSLFKNGLSDSLSSSLSLPFSQATVYRFLLKVASINAQFSFKTEVRKKSEKPLAFYFTLQYNGAREKMKMNKKIISSFAQESFLTECSFGFSLSS
jgi:hypothetical protein